MAEKGSARVHRLAIRKEAREIREDFAMRGFASGLTYAEITLAMAEEFGTSRNSSSNTIDMVRRALNRHRVDVEDIELARVRIIAILDRLLVTWVPLALGEGLDADLQPRNPSDKAAGIVMTALDRYAQVTGAVKPPEKSTHITVINQVPADANAKRDMALTELRREGAKLVTIDGELANAGTSLEANRQNHSAELMPSPVPTKEKP